MNDPPLINSTSEYRCEATSAVGFIQQLAVSYIANGYWFFVTGWVPKGKDPKAIDAKLIERYGVGISKWSRARRKRASGANLHYIRFERLFVLLATHGEHKFFQEEKSGIRDARRTPLRALGYAISHRGGHSHIRIDQEVYKALKARFLDLAVHRKAEALEAMLWNVPFEPYAPVRRQILNIWRATNRARGLAGFEPLRIECIRMKRRIVKPFDRAAVPTGTEAGFNELEN